MSYWGKVIGGMAGFAMGGPVGALFGAALGHAADEGRFQFQMFQGTGQRAMPHTPPFTAMPGQKEQVFAVSVTVLAAKLAKCDGAVSRTEIDAFKRSFSIPPASVAEVGRLFDSARESAAGFESYAAQLGRVFMGERAVLEQVLAGLNQIARADGPVNGAEADFLSRVAFYFGLDDMAAHRASQGQQQAGPRPQPGEDPYTVLGVGRGDTDEVIRTRWKILVRQNHPDVLASKGASADAVKKASEKVARINAAYDVIKRERRF